MLEQSLGVLLALALGLNLFALRANAGWARLAVAASWFVASVLWKTALAQKLLDSDVHLSAFDWSWNTLNAWVLACLGVALAGRRYLLAWWATNAFLAVLYWFDLLYDRFFDDIPGLYLLSQIQQGPSSLPSGWTLRAQADLGLFFDLPVMLLLIILAGPDRQPVDRRPALLAAIPLLLLDLGFAYRGAAGRAALLRLRFKNIAIVQELGLLNYHFYDLGQYLDPALRNPLDLWVDEGLLKEVTQRSRRSIVADTPFRGACRGRNLLMIQLESLQSFPVHLKIGQQEVMPFLSRLSKDCLEVDLYDQSGQGRSSDGEFVMLNSLLPPGERPLVFAFPGNDYFGLPAVLRAVGYHTTYSVPYLGSFWNCRYMSGRYGFSQAWLRSDFSPAMPYEKLGWGLTDEALYRRLIPRLSSAPQPFFLYAVTLMGHHPYKELDAEDELLDLPAHLEGTMLGRYLQACRLRDAHLEILVDLMKQSGLWENTVVVLVGDHDARMPLADMRQLKDPHFDEVDQVENDTVACLIHCPGDQPRGRQEGLWGQVDLAPTLLHLLGVTDQKTAFLGVNMLGRPEPRRQLFSKGGYGLDGRTVLRDQGVTMRVQKREGLHEETQAPVLVEQMRKELDLALDILRLNLVPKIRKSVQ